VAAVACAFAAPAARAETALDYTTTWLGNTFGGKAGKWVPHGMQGMFVTPDGMTYTTSIWEEGSRELRGYRDGQVFGPHPNLHGHAAFGGQAVTADSTYVYTACGREGRKPAVCRYARTAVDASPDGYYAGDTMFTGSGAQPVGLAVHGGELFVADPMSYPDSSRQLSEQTRISVYDASAFNGTVKRSWAVPRARALAVDAAGYLWVLQQGNGGNAAQIVRYDRNGALQPQRITGIAEPTSIAIDPRNGTRMLVTDNGPDQQVKVYRDITTAPASEGTFGVKGGYLAGPRKGVVGDLRFDGPRGVGIDAAGNVYVGQNGTAGVGDRVWSFWEYGRHAIVESYTPAGALRWRVQGLEFADKAALDPGAPDDVYTRDERLVMDHSRADVDQGSYRGRLLDPFAYPDDPRIQRSGEVTAAHTPWVRRVGGRLLYVLTTDFGGQVWLFRRVTDSEVMAPCGSITGPRIWTDANGNGRDDGGGEVSTDSALLANANGWWPDRDGNIWTATRGGGIYRFALQGYDGNGCPRYDHAHVARYPMPAPFSDLRRIEYHPETDTLYLSGFTPATADTTSNNSWKTLGTTLARYDRWTAGNRSPAWTTEPRPYSVLTTLDGLEKPVSMSVAGDYVFVGWIRQPSTGEQTLRVYRASDGAYVGTMDRRMGEVGPVGWLDLYNSIEAQRRPNGEYHVYAEDDFLSKIVVYRWCPTGTCQAEDPGPGFDPDPGSSSEPPPDPGPGPGPDPGPRTDPGPVVAPPPVTDPPAPPVDEGTPDVSRPVPPAVAVAVNGRQVTFAATGATETLLVRISRRVRGKWAPRGKLRLRPGAPPATRTFRRGSYRAITYLAGDGRRVGKMRFTVGA
jgi:hypothetical protein